MLIDDPHNPDYRGCSCSNCHFGNIPGHAGTDCLFGGGLLPLTPHPDTLCCHRWRPDQTLHAAGTHSAPRRTDAGR